jgi:DNA-binding LacI/PurR family transcriptional regulator
MARAAHDRRYTFLWGDSTHDAADPVNRRAEELCQQYVDRRVSGVFFAPLEFSADQYAINRRIADALKRANIPVVLLDRDLEEFPRRSEFDVVGIDNFAGGYAVAEHLINLGCRRIRFVARPQSAATVDSRIAGCREVLVKNQLDHGAKWIRYGDPADADFVRRLMNGDDGTRPDAFVCANDETAALLMRGLREQGFKVPSDVRIVGFDDVKYATLLPVALTTIHQPCQDIGEAAVRVMIDRLANPNSPAREIIIHAPLVVRASCGAKAHVAVG